jgi:hypothetical protein
MKGKAPAKQRGKGKAKAIDDASRSAIEKKKKSADPWEGVRSAPSRQGKE